MVVCQKCHEEMLHQYEVLERDVLFTLWDCPCGAKHLERTYQKRTVSSAS